MDFWRQSAYPVRIIMYKLILPYLSLAISLAVFLSGCSENDLMRGSGSEYNSDIVSFTAQTGRGSGNATSRAAGEEELYEPLELTGENGGDTIYLHTHSRQTRWVLSLMGKSVSVADPRRAEAIR